MSQELKTEEGVDKAAPITDFAEYAAGIKSKLPDDCKETDLYPIASDIGVLALGLTQVPDLETGGQRSRKFGACIGIHVVPNLIEAQTTGPVFMPMPPIAFIDGDSLSELRARLIYEIDAILDSVSRGPKEDVEE